jgi:hypothetical protein
MIKEVLPHQFIQSAPEVLEPLAAYRAEVVSLVAKYDSLLLTSDERACMGELSYRSEEQIEGNMPTRQLRGGIANLAPQVDIGTRLVYLDSAKTRVFPSTNQGYIQKRREFFLQAVPVNEEEPNHGIFLNAYYVTSSRSEEQGAYDRTFRETSLERSILLRSPEELSQRLLWAAGLIVKTVEDK